MKKHLISTVATVKNRTSRWTTLAADPDLVWRCNRKKEREITFD